jgi:sphingolipid C9-methyltransferase
MSALYGKYQQAPANYVVEGVGYSSFSSRNMYLSILAVPLLVHLITAISFVYFPVVFLLCAFPSFAAFQLISSQKNQPIRPQKGLAGKPIEHYLKFNSNRFDQYMGMKKIPMETFFESYFDGDIDIKGDMLAILEARYDWAAFTFTLNQFKFFLSQWVPETLWHSRKQDQDQVRDHYDRGDDFYNWFCNININTSGTYDDLYIWYIIFCY